MLISRLFRTKSVAQIQDAAANESDAHGSELARELGVIDLTALGIAAVIGAGIFSTIGNASYNGGPAVVFLFLFTAVACTFSALCYAEFASMIPVSGSAYTYAYAAFGEIIAWIIGWDLLLEYAIGNIAVAISWSEYFTGLMVSYGLEIPQYFTMDFLTASRGYQRVTELLAQGQSLDQIKNAADSAASYAGYAAWSDAPVIGGVHIVCDLPALGIIALVTALVYVGIRESKNVSNAMVALKIGVILMVIGLGAFFVKTANWSPFSPNGAAGVLKGVSAVFFAYIGFDAISTTAEECRNPQRDLPRGILYSLVVCTILYVGVSLVLTGMVSYKTLQVGDPLAYVFGPEGANKPWIAGVIAISAVIAMTTVLLVFQLGQPRIWMAMSRDGLLPKIFSAVHPRFKTPWFATLVAGAVVAIPSLFLNLTEVTDLTSIGTLFAFVLVCGGVLILDNSKQNIERRFRVPYINSKYLIPVAATLAIVLCIGYSPFNESVRGFFTVTPQPDETFFQAFSHKIPMIGFLIGAFSLTILCFTKNLSLIPVLGLLTCGYLMTELGVVNWIRFLVWLLVGLIVYFTYGFWHSRLGQKIP